MATECEKHIIQAQAVTGLVGIGSGVAFYKMTDKNTKYRFLKALLVSMLGSSVGAYTVSLVKPSLVDCVKDTYSSKNTINNNTDLNKLKEEFKNKTHSEIIKELETYKLDPQTKAELLIQLESENNTSLLFDKNFTNNTQSYI